MNSIGSKFADLRVSTLVVPRLSLYVQVLKQASTITGGGLNALA